MLHNKSRKSKGENTRHSLLFQDFTCKKPCKRNPSVETLRHKKQFQTCALVSSWLDRKMVRQKKLGRPEDLPFKRAIKMISSRPSS